MKPELILNYPAMVAAVAVSFVFGMVWYGPLFGKKWAKLAGIKMDAKPRRKDMLKSLGLTVFGTFLTAFVLSHASQVWRPSVWHAGPDEFDYAYGFMAGAFTWLGYYVPLLLGPICWERKPWSLFVLNAGYHFLNLQIISMILACWR